MNNRELADTFTLIADLLEIKGEVVYKVLAYRKAADSLTNLGHDINQVWEEGKLTDIPGVGKAIAEKIDELLDTGKLEFLEKLSKEVPLGLAPHVHPGDHDGGHIRLGVPLHIHRHVMVVVVVAAGGGAWCSLVFKGV